MLSSNRGVGTGMQWTEKGTFILSEITEGFLEEATLELGFEVCVGIQEVENAQKGSLGRVSSNSKTTKVFGKEGVEEDLASDQQKALPLVGSET